ncbi:hypothetical protein CVT25_010644 [Psilocybe cyanescens]|uniref:DUF6593 domain-containing protein n=1 Tax=Psilocybe cyanescens TaxID=93625 RepID=A0A409WJX4_PSICY|nr:hypothetical protein CVT25_010644 [Psilocybe cyanescens]
MSPAFGAIPSHAVERSPSWIRLTFISADGDIIDCSVRAFGWQTFFEISTEYFTAKSTTTILTSYDGVTLAKIEWDAIPKVEIFGVLSKQEVSTWIRPSNEALHARIVVLSGQEYIWERYKHRLYIANADPRPKPWSYMGDVYNEVEIAGNNHSPSLLLPFLKQLNLFIVMFGNNPYAQAGWYNPQNPHSINGGPWRPKTTLPPTFGALPPLDQKPASVLEFEFTSFSPDIYNCIVMGPKRRKFFEIRTTSNITVISKPEEQFALIKWSQHPTVEARGALSLQRTGDFLKLSSDSTYRTMSISGKIYVWVPRDNGVYLYSGGPNPPEQFARVRLTGDATKVVLEITSEAFQVGLFEPCIISTMLLFSARNID